MAETFTELVLQGVSHGTAYERQVCMNRLQKWLYKQSRALEIFFDFKKVHLNSRIQ